MAEKRPDRHTSRAPPGEAYAVRRDVPPLQKQGGPVWITRPGIEVKEGAYTTAAANARRWNDRAACWRWLRRRQGRISMRGHALTHRPAGVDQELDDGWYVDRLPDLRNS